MSSAGHTDSFSHESSEASSDSDMSDGNTKCVSKLLWSATSGKYDNMALSIIILMRTNIAHFGTGHSPDEAALSKPHQLEAVQCSRAWTSRFVRRECNGAFREL